MFQVASHPTSFHAAPHMSHRGSSYSTPTQQSQSSSAVQLPRRLSRPKFADLSLDAIAAAAPNLANVPPLYIRETLPSLIPAMMAGISSLASSHLPSSMPRSQVRSSTSIPLIPTHAAVEYPTHLLALSSSSSKQASSPDAPVQFFPIHALILASHCAHVPRLPPPAEQYSSNQLHIVIVPLALPSPAAFMLLSSYMYTHRLDTLLNSLLPIPRGTALSHHDVLTALRSSAALHSLSLYLCSVSQGNLQTLTTHAAHVKELWQDCVALGLHDPPLWDAIDLAWEIVLGGLNLAAGVA